MFPIPWNFPFKKKDGTLTTIDGAISSGGGGGYTLPTASTETKGGVKIGSGLTMTGEVLSNDNPTPYNLPTASADVLGGVKVGSGLSITDGILSADGGGTTPTVDTITLDETTTTGSLLKIVKGDDGFIKITGNINLTAALSTDRVKIASGIAEKYRPGSTNTHWINLQAYAYNASFSTMHECHVEIFGNGNVWVYYPEGVSNFTAYHIYLSGTYRNDIYNG